MWLIWAVVSRQVYWYIYLILKILVTSSWLLLGEVQLFCQIMLFSVLHVQYHITCNPKIVIFYCLVILWKTLYQGQVNLSTFWLQNDMFKLRLHCPVLRPLEKWNKLIWWSSIFRPALVAKWNVTSSFLLKYWHFHPTDFVDFCRKGSRQGEIWLWEKGNLEE